MNYRIPITAVLALGLVAGACGFDDDESSLEAGDVEVAETNADTLGFCEPAAEFVAADDDVSDAEAFVWMAEIMDAMETEGPRSIRRESPIVATALRKYQRTLVAEDVGDVADINDAELPDEVFDDLLKSTYGMVLFEEVADEVSATVLADCGFAFDDDFAANAASTSAPTRAADAADADSATTTTTTTTLTRPPPEPFEEVVDGPFGTGTFNHTRFDIADVRWSNTTPIDYDDPDAALDREDEDSRYLYVTIDLLNEDPNDIVLVDETHLTVSADDGQPIAAQQIFGGDFDSFLDQSSSDTRIYAFDVGDVVPAESLTLRFADDAIPGFIDVIPATETASAYPLAIDGPEPGSYIGNLSTVCEVTYTWTVDDASVSLEIPSEIDGGDGNVNNRARVGTRWLVLDGTVTTDAGVGDCSSPQGVVNRTSLRLMVDGTPIEPTVSPNETLFGSETLELDLIFEIPTDATELAIKAIGRGDSTFESPFTLPELPTVPGE